MLCFLSEKQSTKLHRANQLTCAGRPEGRALISCIRRYSRLYWPLMCRFCHLLCHVLKGTEMWVIAEYSLVKAAVNHLGSINLS